jgi:hypothetical protein
MVPTNPRSEIMARGFDIKNIKNVQGYAHKVTIVLKSGSSAGSEFDVTVNCRDLSKVEADVRLKLLEFADELKVAAQS